MSSASASPARCAVIVGPYTSGKTTLAEALLYQAGAIPRKGSVPQGNTIGDGSPEARAREMSVEPNISHFTFLDEPWHLIDCPGSIELANEMRTSLMAADLAVVVATPEIERALTLAPIFKILEDFDVPHLLFINKMDKSAVRVRDLLEALQAVSNKPLMLRQVPIRDGDDITGFVDLASERAWKYNANKISDLVEMPAGMVDRETEARQEMLESLADFNDDLLEELLEDKVPPTEEVYTLLTENFRNDQIVPVLFGSAEQGHGINRLLKLMRHEGPMPDVTADRLGIPDGGGLAASIVKTYHAAHTGKLSVARLWRGELSEGATVDGDRVSGLFHLMGQDNQKINRADAGDLVALGRMDSLNTGDLITAEGRVTDSGIAWPEPLSPVFSVAVAPKNRQDEVKLTGSIAKLIEEDASLSMEHNEATHQMLLWGQGEIHLRISTERLKSKYNVEVELDSPQTTYKETIRGGTTHHARFKRQTGGHGQFADIHVEIKPLSRGSGFEFVNKVVGGAVPRNYIPAVEAGAKDALVKGPLGFPLVDLEVTLFDGQHHAVDSSDMAFRTAGRMALQEGLPNCKPVLLEPIYEVTISVPNEFTNKVHTLVSGRRGQILGFEMRPGWTGWEDLKCQMPQPEMLDLIVELRSLTMGVGYYTFKFDHLQELTGRTADEVVSARKAALELAHA